MRKGNVTYQIKKLAKRIFTGKASKDDYEWDFYADLIHEGIRDASSKKTQIIELGDYVFKDGRLELDSGILPINPNCQIIYETILHLQPKSIMDIGCGFGDSLHNIHILYPDGQLFGIDISPGVLKALSERHPALNAKVQQCSIKMPPAQLDLPKVDLAYTNAVIMHIRVDHLSALTNLFQIATKQVLLMENWKRHELMADIQSLYDQKKLPWESIYFHYRESHILKKPHLMIISSHPLPQYPVLTDYGLLRNTVNEV
jgi:SAM-dependent methyltransferase